MPTSTRNTNDLRSKNNENTERLVRVETRVDHIDLKVNDIDRRQVAHETNCTNGFAELRENGIRLQSMVENLVLAIKAQNEDRAKVDDELVKRVGVVEEKLTQLYWRAVTITAAGGAVWMILGEKIMQLLGVR